jgi:hypothetical protein
MNSVCIGSNAEILGGAVESDTVTSTSPRVFPKKGKFTGLAVLIVVKGRIRDVRTESMINALLRPYRVSLLSRTIKTKYNAAT